MEIILNPQPTSIVTISNRELITHESNQNQNEKMIMFLSLLSNISNKNEENSKSGGIKLKEQLYKQLMNSIDITNKLIRFLSIANNSSLINKKEIAEPDKFEKKADIIQSKRINYVKKTHYFEKYTEIFVRNISEKEERIKSSQIILENILEFKKFFFIMDLNSNVRDEKIALNNRFFLKFERFFTNKKNFEKKFTFYYESGKRNKSLANEFLEKTLNIINFEMEVIYQSQKYVFKKSDFDDKFMNIDLFLNVNSKAFSQDLGKDMCKLIKFIMYRLFKCEYFRLIKYYKKNLFEEENFSFKLNCFAKKFEFFLTNSNFISVKFSFWKDDELDKELPKIFNNSTFTNSRLQYYNLESKPQNETNIGSDEIRDYFRHSIFIFIKNIIVSMKYEVNLKNIWKFFTDNSNESIIFESLNSTILAKNLLTFTSNISRFLLIKSIHDYLAKLPLLTINFSTNFNIIRQIYSYNFSVENKTVIPTTIFGFSLNMEGKELIVGFKTLNNNPIHSNDKLQSQIMKYEKWNYTYIQTSIINFININQ